MDKSNQPPGPKVSQIANIFQRKTSEEDKDSQAGGNAVMRTESHAARFNHARALFEKLGEGKINRPTTFSIKHSTSKDDNLKDPSPERQKTPSPKKKFTGITNGGGKNDLGMIQNVSRKSEKPEKPEKPERKFNSKELIEKQKNWTSHFSKSRTSPSAGINRCDIIRAVPVAIPQTHAVQDNAKELRTSKTPSIESPPSPSIRQSNLPPDIKPRTTSRSNSLTSPTKALPNIPMKPSPEHVRSQRQPDGSSHEMPEVTKPLRRISSEAKDPSPPTKPPPPPEHPPSRRCSSEKETSIASPARATSSATNSSGPSSPSHTEEEKQENESNEKTGVSDDACVEGKQKSRQYRLSCRGLRSRFGAESDHESLSRCRMFVQSSRKSITGNSTCTLRALKEKFTRRREKNFSISARIVLPLRRLISFRLEHFEILISSSHRLASSLYADNHPVADRVVTWRSARRDADILCSLALCALLSEVLSVSSVEAAVETNLINRKLKSRKGGSLATLGNGEHFLLVIFIFLI